MQTPNTNIIIYQTENGNISVDALMNENNVWLNQEQIAILFGKGRSTITEHINNIFEEGELDEKSVLLWLNEANVGNSDIGFNKPTKFYNLDMILAVGYRVKSKQGIMFRTWATAKLKEYMLNGFVLNEEKLKSGKPTEYFDKVQEKLRQIRLSERLFYQKIKDIYTTSVDYDPKNEKTIEFFKIVQNKLLWAISEQTAAELVHNRVNAELPFLGMKSFDKKNEKEITKQDVSVAKNYLDKNEMETLGLLVEQYLAFAENMAKSQIAMTMNDWLERLDVILEMNRKNILQTAGKITHKLALKTAEKEYEKFKEKQKEVERIESIEELERDLKNI